MKKTRIYKAKDLETIQRDDVRLIGEGRRTIRPWMGLGREVGDALRAGKNVVVTVDTTDPCPDCGGMAVDAGDSFRKQFGATHYICIDCRKIWPEGGA
jgi:predicted RNA-binding Zn-ribbon protein involved in translation (DUF1610 family)